MLGLPNATPRKRSRSATCWSFEPGSVTAIKRDPARSAPRTARTRSKKYCLRMLGSSVVPDLLETRNKVVRMSIRIRWIGSAPDLWSPVPAARDARIEIRKFRASTSGPRLDPAHAKKHDVSELRPSDGCRQGLEVANSPLLLIHDVEPAKPLAFIASGPKAGIAVPEAAHVAGAPPSVEFIGDRFFQIGRQRVCLAIELGTEVVRPSYGQRRRGADRKPPQKASTPSITSASVT